MQPLTPKSSIVMSLRHLHLPLAAASLVGTALVSFLIYKLLKPQQRRSRMDYSKKAVVVETIDVLETAMTRIIEDTSSFKVIGLDCEWCSERSGKRRPIALLQLATISGYSVLIRLCKLDNRSLPQSLRDLLANRSILKVGVAVLDDANHLLTDHHLPTRGCLDLRYVASRHMPRDLRSKFTGSLKNLADIFLNKTLDKSEDVRCGDWEADVMSTHQIRYGAQDVLVAVDIFLSILQGKFGALPDRADDNLWSQVASMCQGLLDVKYKTKATERKTNTNVLTEPIKTTTKTSNAYKPRQTQMYHNCRLIAPSGELLCTCHKQKAEWYIKKGIGELECEEPFTVRLKFEPSGMPGLDRAYYLQDKANMCVVCGSEDSYIRKNIVPHEYRRHFPEVNKKHTSHDVVLLCLACHQLSSSYDRIIRNQLTVEYNAPITNSTNARYREDPRRLKARSAAKALKRNTKVGKLPEQRVDELKRILSEFWNVEEVSVDIIDETLTLDVKCENEEFQGSHGEKVVNLVMKDQNGIEKFEKRWRQQFLETMKPKFMPALWSVHHRHTSVDSNEDNQGSIPPR
ncbi:exonuclease 3'-5' domain-containing protein 2-like isoform X2 [Asterias rubens]|uniref:exonuclease 3'-5' domain-containing protein 2-like isoform X2 n=1 Tax=Asterias rubens TaxID=7604 RepID=UPI00145570F7|nr:exonuclease 3'-5' domain-containing protein 2-like isoform X2 [Asterias rubens]